MLNCAYCAEHARTSSGMAMHWSRNHPDKWVNTLKESQEAAKLVVPGFDPGTPEPRRKAKSKRPVLTEEQKKIRRKQQKDWYDKHKRKRSVAAPPVGLIKFCPNCGYNLELIMVAIGMAQRVSSTIAHETGRNS